MKKIITKILHRPKIVIAGALMIAVVVVGLLYNHVGQPPVVSISLSDDTTGSSSSEILGNSTNLSFLRNGRISTVLVHNGDLVKKGDVLATLDAGDVLGSVDQAKGALELAKAQYSSMEIQYSNAKKQQDLLVENAYKTLLSSNLSAIAQDRYSTIYTVDDSQVPQISGTYSCGKEGLYEVIAYNSGVPSGYSFNFTGLESGSGNVTYHTPQPLGSCGLFVQFPVGFYSSAKWIIDIPNKRSSSYVINKNAYDLAVTTRNQVLSQFEANLGKNGSSNANIAQATINSVNGSYESALATYNNTIIVAPIDGVISFVDSHFKVGESVVANKTLITIIKK